MRRILAIPLLLLALALPARSAAEDTVVVPNPAPDYSYWTLDTETLAGVVLGQLPLPMFPNYLEPLPNDAAVFTGGGDAAGVWLARAGLPPTRLTANPNDRQPTATRDGSRIAFSRYDPATGSADIFALNSDGSGLQRLTNSEGVVELNEPEFSPDGRTIAYTCKRAQDANGFPVGGPPRCGPQRDGVYLDRGLVLMNADGSNPRMILRADVDGIAWSPDARWMVLTADIPVALGNGLWTGYQKMFVIRTDGTDLFADASNQRVVRLPVSPPELTPFYPSFSPDGKRILFGGAVAADNCDYAFIVGVDGSNFQKLSLHALPNWPMGTFVLPATGAGPPVTADATHLTVPAMRGVPLAKAEDRLEAKHFEVIDTGREFSATVRRGRVIRTVPRAGAKSHRVDIAGAPIRVYVSKGPRSKRHRG